MKTSYWESKAELLEHYTPLSVEEALGLRIIGVPIFWSSHSGYVGCILIQVWWGLEVIQGDLRSDDSGVYYIPREKAE